MFKFFLRYWLVGDVKKTLLNVRLYGVWAIDEEAAQRALITDFPGAVAIGLASIEG